ncbi:MAG: aminoglycoside phosphotransferase [Gammaproteobacteria bacterium]|nr:aminoglycoside phosphotransferase [Gammaproteobacteria bacterium]
MIIGDDIRKITLLDWLENDLLMPVSRLEPASSDASFRRYFRITVENRQLIAMDAPPEKENIAQFIKVAEMLRPTGIKVPAIYHRNLDDGFLVLEDFGSISYLDRLNQDTVTELYGKALASLFQLQSHSNLMNADLPRYDEALLERELGIFEEWFLNRLMDITISPELWEHVRRLLINSALEQPVTCVHRDFHSRNLMILISDSPGVIDFQDAVIGPITYDLASLLRDCYIAWPQTQIEHWLQQHHNRLLQAGLIDCALPVFTRWFDLMGMQRHLKAIGIFSRLHLRDGKSGYLKDIPRTMGYVLAQAGAYPELSDFYQFLLHNVDSAYLPEKGI